MREDTTARTWNDLRLLASNVARSTSRSPVHLLRSVVKDKVVERFFGLLTTTERVTHDEVLMRYWPLQWQVTLKLDESPSRWMGPVDGDVTTGWTVILRDDGRLLHSSWCDGVEPGAPKGTLKVRPMR